MKKYTLFLFLFAFSLFNVNLATAAGPYNDYTAGCTSDVGFSPTTGERCRIITSTSTTLPAGCTATSNYSSTTGQLCGNKINTIIGCSPGFLFSSVTGEPCSNVSGGGGSSSGGIVLDRILQIGLRGEDIKLVQQFLKDEGYYLGKVDGKYGPRTARAVREFQEDSDLTVTGKIDSVTIALMNSLGADGGGTVVIQPYPPVSQPPIILPTQPPYYYESAPVIKGVDGPQSLNVNQQGTWTVTAYDRSGGNLSYEVDWGEAYIYGALNTKTAIQQSATFTHNYSQAGTYTPTFYVTNSNGQRAQTSLSVNVGGTSTCSSSGFDSRTGFRCGCNGIDGYSSYDGQSCNPKPNSGQITIRPAKSVGKIYKPGQSNVVLAEFNFSASFGTSVNFSGLGFWGFMADANGNYSQYGASTSSQFMNFTLWVNGVNVAQVANADTYGVITPLSPNPFGAYDFPVSYGSPTKVVLRADVKDVPDATYVFALANYGTSGSPKVDYLDSTGFLFSGRDSEVRIVGSTISDLAITTSSPLPNAKVGQYYSASFYASGLTEPSVGSTFTLNPWSSFPSGIGHISNSNCNTLSCVGSIGGTPTSAGTYTFTLILTEAGGRSTSKQFTLTVDSDISGSLNLISPNGGETWIKSATNIIKWQDPTTTPCQVGSICGPTAYDIVLSEYFPLCTGDICPMYFRNPVNYNIAKNITDTSFSWGGGGILEGGIVPDGSYTIQICKTGSSICDSSDSYFKIISQQTQPLTLSASRDSASPSSYINVGTKGAEIFRINLSASGQDAYVTQLKLGLAGVATRYLSNIQAFVDGNSVGTLSNLVNTSSWYYTAVINTSGLTVPTGGSKTISIRGDVSPDVWSGVTSPCPSCTREMWLTLDGVTTSPTASSVSGLPVNGNSVYIPFSLSTNTNLKNSQTANALESSQWLLQLLPNTLR